MDEPEQVSLADPFLINLDGHAEDVRERESAACCDADPGRDEAQPILCLRRDRGPDNGQSGEQDKRRAESNVAPGRKTARLTPGRRSSDATAKPLSTPSRTLSSIWNRPRSTMPP